MKKIKIIFWILVLLAGAAFVYRDKLDNFWGQFSNGFEQLERLSRDILTTELGNGVSNPPPLRSDADAEGANLTQSGILDWTNRHRADSGLLGLALSPRLSAAAEKKADDMFRKQYFAHVSPDGEDAALLAQREGYDYISIGENLAMGNFKDDEALVQAWMDSPGHKANILKSSYEEIGISAKRGTFEGRDTWLAVQIFGRPTTACPRPESGLIARIDENERRIDELKEEIAALKQQIDQDSGQSREEYNEKVRRHNELVRQHNDLVRAAKVLVDQYNARVIEYNSCLKV